MSKFYVNNEELTQELEDYVKSCTFKQVLTGKGKVRTKIKKRGKVSDRLGSMISKIIIGLSTRPNWSGYTWREDFVSFAILTALKYMHNFDAAKSPNAHGYISMIANHAFLQYIEKEKNHSNIKQELYNKKEEIDYETTAVDYKELKNKGEGYFDD